MALAHTTGTMSKFKMATPAESFYAALPACRFFTLSSRAAAYRWSSRFEAFTKFVSWRSQRGRYAEATGSETWSPPMASTFSHSYTSTALNETSVCVLSPFNNLGGGTSKGIHPHSEGREIVFPKSFSIEKALLVKAILPLSLGLAGKPFRSGKKRKSESGKVKLFYVISFLTFRHCLMQA